MPFSKIDATNASEIFFTHFGIDPWIYVLPGVQCIAMAPFPIELGEEVKEMLQLQEYAA